ncbi:MAG: DUF4870 domain-containing protein [Candidatus Nanohaloarchaeota archaeon QJJ-7]|nr:DUF4870 domain-containing protein [Candidatus Nanohaloarchaeota archaeon QJJ-7]
MANEPEATFGLDENLAGALCYVLGFITGAIFYLSEDENEFVRFHAVQSIITFLGIWIVSIVLGMLSGVLFFVGIGMLMGLVTTLIYLIGLALWLLLMFKAYEGERYKLPLVGRMAEKHA